MVLTTARRIIRAGFLNFWRNGFVSLAAVVIMTIALFVIGSLIFFSAVLNTALTELRNKADINVYFITTASESDILVLKKEIEVLPEVENVIYTSREEALDRFKARHESDELILRVFDILGENPLGASLTIKAKEVSQYEGIARFLKKGDTALSSEAGTPIIDDINYNKNKLVIDRLSRVIDTGRLFGIVLSITLIVISVLITFNTIRLAIYTARDEIGIMNLVGARAGYIRGPFVVSGIMYGLISSLLTIVAFYLLTFWLEKMGWNYFTGFNLFRYYISTFWKSAGIIVGAGVVLGALSSFLAVRRYLKA